MQTHPLWTEFAKAIRHELKPALGCTEPISLALASAIAARHLGAAPERIDGGPATAASDVYGLGATMWSAATARRPPTHRPPDPAAVARGLDVIIAECCDPDPARRPTASAVLRVAESERRRRDRYCPAP